MLNYTFYILPYGGQYCNIFFKKKYAFPLKKIKKSLTTFFELCYYYDKINKGFDEDG